MIARKLSLILTVVCHLVCLVSSHGRLMDPISRSSMWRKGYNTPQNYQDNELNCGGYDYQVSKGYKCGLCGDPYGKTLENETGGKYAKGIIAKVYLMGQVVTFEVELTAFHLGFFEFKICQRWFSHVRETQACFDQHLLKMADGSGTKYYPQPGNSLYKIKVQLPKGLLCDFCVLQWRYHSGNTWGIFPNGTRCVGCGYQEEFYGCADIDIYDNTVRKPKTTYRPESKFVIKKLYNKVCRGVRGQSHLNRWCNINCNQDNCPPQICECDSALQPLDLSQGCQAIGFFASIKGADRWCVENCEYDECPSTHCAC